MKDFPVFPCNDGIVSLVLGEIPYRGEAYIIIRSVFGSVHRLLRECGDFCRGAGAKKIYVSGGADLSFLPVYAHLMERSLSKAQLPQSSAKAELTSDPEWVSLYNERFACVHAARTYIKIPKDAYFIYEKGVRIGLGQIIADELAAVASLKKGCGQACVCAMSEKISSDTVKLLCAEENLPATKLYDRMGFSRDSIKRVWCCL